MTGILPGWNSIESATRWHKGFEIAGFVALGLLLLFEVLAYIYGTRKDTLSSAQQADIVAKAAKLEARFAQRILSEDQKATLLTLLSQHKGLEVILLNVLGDKDSQEYRDEFAELFQRAGWTVKQPPFRLPVRDVQGLRLLVADLAKAPQAAIVLQQALKAVGIDADGAVDSGLTPNDCEFYIGFK